MNILFIGNTSGSSGSLHYFTNLLKLEHAVIPFDPQYFMPRNLIERARIRLGRKPTEDTIRRVANQLVDICARNAFDCIFVMSENFLSADTIETIRLRSKKAPLFIYHSHDNNFSSGILKPADFDKTIAAYDFVFTTKSQNVDRYKKLGQEKAYFIPSAYEPTVHQPIKNGNYESGQFQASFIGTYDHSRDEPLKAVGWEKLNVWGDHWKKFPEFSKYKTQIVPRAVYYFEFADIIGHSKISLGLLREEAGDKHTQRTFEIPACGGFQLAPRSEEILDYFTEDQEIVCFKNLEELHDKVQFYLANPATRHRIAKKGYEACLAGKHTYRDRLEMMFRFIKSSRRAKPLRYAT
jgi:spore maturation protein CgeB